MMAPFRQELNRKITIKESGRVRKVTSREAIAMTATKLALKGDPKVHTRHDGCRSRSQRAREAQGSQNYYRGHDGRRGGGGFQEDPPR